MAGIFEKMNCIEKKVLSAVQNGWYLSGVYEVSFKGHNRVFRADSIRWLFKDIMPWYESHLENHWEDRILVRMLKAV